MAYLYNTYPYYHATLGVFFQNSFQMDSSNSCSTSKKLQFQLKIVKIVYFTQKPVGLYSKKNEKKMLGGTTSQKSQKKSKNCNISTIILPLGVAWVPKEAV